MMVIVGTALAMLVLIGSAYADIVFKPDMRQVMMLALLALGGMSTVATLTKRRKQNRAETSRKGNG